MKTITKNFRKFTYILILTFLFLLNRACEKPATTFDNVEDAVSLQKKEVVSFPDPDSSIKIMTWNIRYGFARGPWFGDACGYKVIYSEEEIMNNLRQLAKRIREVDPDILFLQEAEINSTRSSYVNELEWILNNTNFNYAVYGLQWKAQFVPSDGLGRIEESNAILSRWKLKNGTRIQLKLRGDQIAIERYFYERYCMVEAEAEIPGHDDIVLLNIHAAAFASDDTKQKNLQQFETELDNISKTGKKFIAGGDLNTLPPGSTKTDYCLEDMCEGESFHKETDDPMHKEGSNYTPETEWISGIYKSYKSAIPLNDYLPNQPLYYTHTTRPGSFWDRTLDYLFTNSRWVKGSGNVRQDFLLESDHAPVVGNVIL